MDTIAVGALARVFETVGLSLFLTWVCFFSASVPPRQPSLVSRVVLELGSVQTSWCSIRYSRQSQRE